jgi:transposase InsO family protein
MVDLYRAAGLSKQAMWKYRRRLDSCQGIRDQVVKYMADLRKRHMMMGCRVMYAIVKDQVPIGRDAFEQIGFANGFKLRHKRNPRKTTWAQRVEIHPNLVEGLEVTNINQAWQCDIFYQEVEGRHFYGVTIVDVYSRRLLSLHMAKSLAARHTAVALRKAIQMRRGHDLADCIFHSDRGGQFISAEVKTILRSNDMVISMCKMPQENAYVERLQGTLKNQYLYPHQPTSSSISSLARRIMRYYNEERPHSSLGNMTPLKFERMIASLPPDQRPSMKVFDGFSDPINTSSRVVNKRKKKQKRKP